MKITIVGAGAIGGYFGGLLAKAGENVHFFDQGDHLKALKEKGLVIKSTAGDFSLKVKATSDPTEIGVVNLVLFCVKSYDTHSVAKLILPMVAEDTAIISLQNGVDNEEKVAQVVGADKVLGGVVYIQASVSEPGVINQTGGPRKIIFGELDGRMTRRVERIHQVLKDAGIACEISSDIKKALWEKLLLNSPANALTTITSAGYQEVLQCPATKKLFLKVMREVVEVARSQNVPLEDETIERIISILEGFGNQKSSMLVDFEMGKRLEVEALNGVIVKLGEEASIPTPYNEALYACLTLMDAKRRGRT